jgi:uncharacterized protein
MHTDGSTINYGVLLNGAMYGVVREALRQIENDCLPGKHLFYISFLTHFKGVKVSEAVKQKYPNELTIVLQYQFKDLFVEEDRFSVSVSFNNRQERICIPYKSILRFVDPSVNIELSFIPIEDGANAQTENTINVDMKCSKDSISVQQIDNVINLDEFRKNKES